jgi:hypothetical protein
MNPPLLASLFADAIVVAVFSPFTFEIFVLTGCRTTDAADLIGRERKHLSADLAIARQHFAVWPNPQNEVHAYSFLLVIVSRA